MGFAGPVMTDDLVMEAASCGDLEIAQRIGRAAAAGCDLFLVCGGEPVLSDAQIARLPAGNPASLPWQTLAPPAGAAAGQVGGAGPRPGLEDAAALAAPHVPEAEKVVIGVLLADNAKFDDLPEGGLSHDDFYQSRHQLIYQHMQLLYGERKTAADAITVAQSLAGAEKLEEIGGHEYLGDLQQQGDIYPNFSEYARLVREMAVLRRLLDEARTIRDQARHRGDRSVDEIVDDAERRICELAAQFRDHRFGSIRGISVNRRGGAGGPGDHPAAGAGEQVALYRPGYRPQRPRLQVRRPAGPGS